MTIRPHFGYVIYWGALEPVGLATAVPTVLGLADRARVTLFSFEKSEDQSDGEALEGVSRRLDEAGVRWVRLPYTPRYRGTPLDVFRGARTVWKVHREDPFQAIEGRTFVGGLVGALAARALGVPFLYHTEGCWLDEQVDVGRMGSGSPILRLLRTVDAWTLTRADALIALTEAGATRLRSRSHSSGEGIPTLVIPTTSVLVGTAPAMPPARRVPPGEPVRAVYAGSVTGRYLFDELLSFFAELERARPGSTLEVLAHRDREVAREAIARHRLEGSVTLDAVPHSQLPGRLLGRDLGFFFLQEGDSVECVSPTKIPEYLEHGIPVVCTRASGDGAEVVARARAGVILDDPRDPSDRARALDELAELLVDPDRSKRAQDMAREHYSLAAAVDSQLMTLLELAGEGLL